MVPRDTARGIILHNNHILLIERWRDDLHYFSVPGGGIELGEMPAQTVERELYEETACVVLAKREVYTVRFADRTRHHIFLCQYVSGEVQLRPDAPEAVNQHQGNRFKPQWVPVSALPETPFLIWQPIKNQLLHDLEYGFADGVQELV